MTSPDPVRRAVVKGAGVAGLACAGVLARQGWTVAGAGTVPRMPPVLVLNAVTCGLVRDLCAGGGADPLDGAVPLASRMVAPAGEPRRSVPAVGAAVSGDALLAALRAAVPESAPFGSGEAWTVVAGGRGDAGVRCGDRWLVSAPVTLARGADPAATCYESLAGAWLFLTPAPGGGGLVQAMVPSAPADADAAIAELLGRSRVVWRLVCGASGPAHAFEAAPRTARPRHGERWIAVGDAALALDPLAGDGVGSAVRGAVLAAAVMEGIASGLPAAECFDHYERRLDAAFRSHLTECLGYYAGGAGGWDGEVAAMRDAVAALPHDRGPFHFALHDGRLVRRGYSR